MRRHATAAIVAVMVAAALTLLGCGDSSPSDTIRLQCCTTSTSTGETTCADAQDVDVSGVIPFETECYNSCRPSNHYVGCYATVIQLES